MIFIFCSFWHCFISNLYPKCILKTLTHVFSLKVEILHYAVKQRQCREPVLPGWTNTFSTILTMDTWLLQKTCLCPCPRVVFMCQVPVWRWGCRWGILAAWSPREPSVSGRAWAPGSHGGSTVTPRSDTSSDRTGTGRADGAQEHR